MLKRNKQSIFIKKSYNKMPNWLYVVLYIVISIIYGYFLCERGYLMNGHQNFMNFFKSSVFFILLMLITLLAKVVLLYLLSILINRTRVEVGALAKVVGFYYLIYLCVVLFISMLLGYIPRNILLSAMLPLLCNILIARSCSLYFKSRYSISNLKCISLSIIYIAVNIAFLVLAYFIKYA